MKQELINQESLFIDDNDHRLHLRHIYKQPGCVPVLMVHGIVENGLIFYTEKGKGFACYLAEQGFDVYVLDLRGRGKSTPAINAESDHGQYEAITNDIPLAIEHVYKAAGQRMHLVSHSWGGILAASCMARHEEVLLKVRSNLCFGSKRRVTVTGFEKFLKLDLFWNRVAMRMVKKQGFLDAKKYNFGSDNETRKSLEHSVTWVNKGPWHDPQDGFDYQTAAENIIWPPTWHLTGIKDTVLGHAVDVQLFIEESKNHHAKFSLLSKQNGNLVDYDHINILTHPLAVQDHFPQLVTWLKQQG